MTSTQKVYQVLEHMADMDDEQIAEALPVPLPPAMVRSVVAFIAPRVPSDHRVLDEFLTGVGDFCHSLRSDHAAAQVSAK